VNCSVNFLYDILVIGQACDRQDRSGSLGGRSRSGSSNGGGGIRRRASGGNSSSGSNKQLGYGSSKQLADVSSSNCNSEQLMASATTALEALVASWKQQPLHRPELAGGQPPEGHKPEQVPAARVLQFPEEKELGSWWSTGTSWSSTNLENYFRQVLVK
jgi:hypothetical protein